jgi:hypothetical protein
VRALRNLRHLESVGLKVKYLILEGPRIGSRLLRPTVAADLAALTLAFLFESLALARLWRVALRRLPDA